MIRIIEAIQSYLKHLNESLAECAMAVTETSNTLTALADSNHALRSKLAELFDQQAEQNQRINRYLFDQAQKERSDARLRADFEAFKSEVREKKAAGA